MRRQDIIAEAQSWLGTPYRHQASLEGVGADCLGLIRGVWRELYGAEPQLVPAYAPDWAERSGQDDLFGDDPGHEMHRSGYQDAPPSKGW